MMTKFMERLAALYRGSKVEVPARAAVWYGTNPTPKPEELGFEHVWTGYAWRRLG